MPDNNTASNDEDVVRLAQAERDAGIPDLQTAEAAADARQRSAARDDEGESAAHPS